MDAVKVIPCLDIKDGRVVKGVHFVELRDAADPVEAAQAYSAGGADAIAFLDITATVENRRTKFDVIKRVAAAVKVPLIAGGGITCSLDIEEAMAAGANAVTISSAAYRNPEMIEEAVKRFGSDRIIIAIDADVSDTLPSEREVYIDGGRTPTGEDAVGFAMRMREVGAEQFLPTSKAADGTKAGFDLQLTRQIADATNRTVIASGGAGTLEHFHQAVVEGHAKAVLAASVFHFGVFTVRQVKEYLKSKGVPVLL